MIETEIPQRALAALVGMKTLDPTTIVEIRFQRSFLGTIDGTVITEHVEPNVCFGPVITDAIIRREYQWTGNCGWIRIEESRRRNA
jgi:hypothetical protein